VDNRSIIVGSDALKEAVAIDRRDHALMFATDHYDHWNDLVNPIFDATAIGKELKERYGFDVDIVTDPDQYAVFNKLKEYAGREYKPQDQLFVFLLDMVFMMKLSERVTL